MKISTLNRTDALKLDEEGEFFEEWDPDTGLYCVFGTESDFCYATFSDEGDARKRAGTMNEDHSTGLSR